MAKMCRFCGGVVHQRFAANKRNNMNASNFACTNCGFGSHGPIVECNTCKIVYVDEKISQEKISTYYEVAEDPMYFKEQEARKVTFINYLNKLEKQTNNKGKLLDVGTNTGLFVRVARDSGWNAIGLEPNKWGIEYAKKNYGLDLINKPFEKGVFPKESFDVITMWDVIEHFTDPVKEMEKVFWYLKPGGVFAFSTVDPNSILARMMGTKWSWYMDMHRVFFDTRGAKNHLEKVGFKKILFSPHWRYLSMGYFATRLKAVNPKLSDFLVKLIALTKLNNIIIPYYANDLFDCYATK